MLSMPRIGGVLVGTLCLQYGAPTVFAAVIAGTSTAGTPLFSYETVQLTAEDLARLGDQHAALLDFEHEDNPAPVLKAGQCRAFPGTDAWPSQSAWDALDRALGRGGALIPTVPAAAPCYQDWGVYDADKCADVIANWTNPYFHESDPTSIMWPLFQGRTCMPPTLSNDTASPDGCTLGGYPAYAVRIGSVTQVQLAVNFARNSNLRLVVKNTGHCYLGKSSGAGALAVWTHNLKDIEFLPAYRGQEGGDEVPAFKVGAGVTVREIYRAADENGVTVSGGICESVGFTGGYLQGGGHTPMSGMYGMAADHVLAFEVVTASGRFVTASASSNPDLFWALRGGGGGTYGVVTSAIVRARPRVRVVTSVFNISTYSPETPDMVEASPDAFWAAVGAFFARFVEFEDAGTYSYFWMFSGGGGRLRLQMMPFWAPNHTLASFDALVGPLFSTIRDELRLPGFEPRTAEFDSFYPAYHDSWGNETVGTTSVPANRLFPRSALADPARRAALLAALRAHAEEQTGRIWGGYHQAPRNRSGADNGVSSAWREAAAFLISGQPVAAGAGPAEVAAANARLLDVVIRRWRDVAPASEGGGSYLNEGSPVEPDWQASYYGAQYPRLLRIKKAWDPSGLFYVTTGVGSEGWEVRDGEQGTQTQNGRLCRV